MKDGSLEYRPTKEDKADKKKYQIFKNNYNWVLGVSKNFNPEVCVDISGKPNPGFIADLPLYHRTPVACFRNPVCYGSDLRWANHLYPIYLTETYVKSKYLSAESFLHLF